MSTEMPPPNSQEQTTTVPVPDFSGLTKTPKLLKKLESPDTIHDKYLGNLKIIQLKADVSSLENKVNILRYERNQQKQTQVSKTELELLKSQIRYSTSIKESAKSDEIIKAIVDEARESKILGEQISILEQRINDAIHEREIQTEEEKLLFDTLDMNDIIINPIKFTDVDSQAIDGIQIELALLKLRQESIENELADLEEPKEIKETPASISRNIFKSYESRWKLTCLGKKEIQNEIHSLTNDVNETESINVSLESDIRKKYKQIQERDKSNQSVIDTLVSQVNNNYNYFKQQLDIAEQEKRELEKKLNNVAIDVNNVLAEIDIIKKQKPIPISESISEPPSENYNDEPVYNGNIYDDVIQSSTLESSLRSHKRLLESEIMELNLKYNDMKEEAQKSLDRKKKAIIGLNDKYQRSKLKLREVRKSIPDENDDDNFSKIANSVDKNLNDLKDFVSTL